MPPSPRPRRRSAPPSVPRSPGLHGFRRSHEGAVAVQRLLLGQPNDDRLATYAELEVTALTSGDEQRAAEFVLATLGRLAEDTPSAARLRETLRVYLDVADNAPAAAVRLHLHRNTVLQRVGKATELLGYEIGDRRLALTLALELAHRLGARMLVTPQGDGPSRRPRRRPTRSHRRQPVSGEPGTVSGRSSGAESRTSTDWVAGSMRTR